jgi:hypothetical protein
MSADLPSLGRGVKTPTWFSFSIFRAADFTNFTLRSQRNPSKINHDTFSFPRSMAIVDAISTVRLSSSLGSHLTHLVLTVFQVIVTIFNPMLPLWLPGFPWAAPPSERRTGRRGDLLDEQRPQNRVSDNCLRPKITCFCSLACARMNALASIFSVFHAGPL